MSEEVVITQEAVERGYEPRDVNAGVVALFGLGVIAALIVVLFAVQSWYNHVREQQVYEKVMVPVSEDLRNLHAREDGQLHTYRYVDKAKGVVRLPIERAMDLYAQEAAAGKFFYPTNNAPVVKLDPNAPAVPEATKK